LKLLSNSKRRRLVRLKKRFYKKSSKIKESRVKQKELRKSKLICQLIHSLKKRKPSKGEEEVRRYRKNKVQLKKMINNRIAQEVTEKSQNWQKLM
jgi:hypothetical protein